MGGSRRVLWREADDPSPVVRERAIVLLAALASDDELGEALSHPDPRRRLAAARALAERTPTVAALAEVRACLAEEAEPEVRAALAAVLTARRPGSLPMQRGTR